MSYIETLACKSPRMEALGEELLGATMHEVSGHHLRMGTRTCTTTRGRWHRVWTSVPIQALHKKVMAESHCPPRSSKQESRQGTYATLHNSASRNMHEFSCTKVQNQVTATHQKKGQAHA